MRMKTRTRQTVSGYMFIGLWIIGFLVFTLWPLIQTFMLSLNSVRISTSGILQTPVGFKNYQDAFLLDVNFTRLLINYATETLVSVPIIIVFSLLIAMMLNENLPGRGIFRTIFFLPVIITSGPVIEKLTAQGSATLPGLADFVDVNSLAGALPDVFQNLISYLIESFIVLLWFTGVQILIFIAGLQKMDSAIYEAASIDGASRWESFWKITLPSLHSMIILNVVYTVISLSLFALNDIIVKISSATFSVSEGGLGYAAALSWIYFVAMLLMLGLFLLIFAGRRKNR